MSSPIDQFELVKNIWTQDDFEQMGWHDANIYGLTFEKKEGAWSADLLFDIDYIFQWVQNEQPEKAFTFWVAPCTLIFKEAFALSIDLNTLDYALEGLEIADLYLIKKEDHGNGSITYHWKMELQTGNIEFQSQGFSQIVRQKPLHISGQSLELEQRGGVNFGRIPC